MTEMAERAGRAALDAVKDFRTPCHGESAETYAYCKNLVAGRAAIAAMREPTEGMYEALSATGKMWREMNSREVWYNQIDAALSEEP